MPTNNTVKGIQELEDAHCAHIEKLKSLHAFQTASLESSLKASRERCREQEAEVEGLKEQVGVLRQSFELVQERLKRVLLEQDQLVEMIRSLSLNETGTTSTPTQVIKTNDKRVQSELADLEKIYGLDSSSATEAPSDQESTVALPKLYSHCLKYLRKLQTADPLQLCRLLELPFTAEKPFALADSLLTGMLTYTRSPDSNEFTETVEARIVRLLVWELVQGRRECLALVRRMIEADVVGIDEFTEKAGDESSCVRIALRGNENNSFSLTSLTSMLGKLI